MSAREIIAYAITHAPPGVKGGPYESKRGGYGDPWPTLTGASQWRGARGRGPDEEDLELARMTLADVRKVHPDARVIRIVRARSNEASARAVLAAAGPDPMPVVRAAMAWWLACQRRAERPLDLELKTLDAVDTYRKAGGK